MHFKPVFKLYFAGFALFGIVLPVLLYYNLDIISVQYYTGVNRENESMDNFIEFPKVLKDYIEFHKVNRDLPESKYLIYTCNKSVRKCGGLGDRLNGIISAFYLAIEMNRVFLIDYDRPEPLIKALEPSIVNWEVPEMLKTLNQIEKRKIVCLTAGSCKKIEKVLKDESVQAVKAIYLNIGLSLISKHTSNFNLPETQLFLEKLIQDKYFKDDDSFSVNSYSWAYSILFKHTLELSKRIVELKSTIGIPSYEKYNAIHIRFGKGSNVPDKRVFHTANENPEIMKCITTMQKHCASPSTIIMSDSVEERNYITSQNKNINSLNVKPFHIDKFDKFDSRIHELTIDTYAEFIILSEASCLMLSNSGFGKNAMAISNSWTKMFYFPDNCTCTLRQ